MLSRRLVQGTLALSFALAALVAACGPKPPPYNPNSLNGEQNLTNGVWLFGFDDIASRHLSERARSGKGLIAVRLVRTADGGAHLEVLDQCFVEGYYQYKALPMMDRSISIKSADELRATLPFTYAKFSGEFSQSSELSIQYRSPGDYIAGTNQFQLSGSCNGATHVVTYLTVGAFRTKTAAQQGGSVGGGTTVPGGPSGGWTTGGSNEDARGAGNMESCNSMNFFGGAPLDCSMPLKLTLAALQSSPAPAAGGPAGSPAASSASTCSDPSTMANQSGGYHFDGKVFVIERPQLAALDPNTKANFACIGAVGPAENAALDATIAFLKKRPGVQAHVSVYCTVLIPGFDPGASHLHKQTIMAKFAAAGLSGRVTFNDCVGMPPLSIGDGVSVELVGGCSDHPQPPPKKCVGGN